LIGLSIMEFIERTHVTRNTKYAFIAVNYSMTTTRVI